MKKINEKELKQIFKNLKQEREKGFNELYEKYNKLIYGIAFSILKNHENSEDIVQMIFTKIYKMENKKLPTTNEASWLYSLTKNETLNYIRKEKNNLQLEDLDYISYEDEELNQIVDKDAFNRLMQKLDKQEQEIVSLKILAKMKFKDIAKLLDLPIGTIQWKYYTALHSLKLLIGNISIFLLGVTLFISNKENKIRQNSNANMSEGEIDSIIETVPDNDAIHDAINSNELIDSILDKEDIDNVVQNEQINQHSTTQEETIIQEGYIEPQRDNIADIGIITLLGIFLIFTMIFTMIFIKHQQNRKNKVSK